MQDQCSSRLVVSPDTGPRGLELSAFLLLPQSLHHLFQQLRHARLRLMHVIHARAKFCGDGLSRSIEQNVLLKGTPITKA